MATNVQSKPTSKHVALTIAICTLQSVTISGIASYFMVYHPYKPPLIANVCGNTAQSAAWDYTQAHSTAVEIILPSSKATTKPLAKPQHFACSAQVVVIYQKQAVVPTSLKLWHFYHAAQATLRYNVALNPAGNRIKWVDAVTTGNLTPY